MRYLFYIPLLNKSTLDFVICMSEVLFQKNDTVHFVCKETSKVIHNGITVLSKNHENVEKLKTKFGKQHISTLLSDLSVKVMRSDEIFEQHNRALIEAVADVFKPDIVFSFDIQNIEILSCSDLTEKISINCFATLSKKSLNICYLERDHNFVFTKCKEEFSKFVENITSAAAQKLSQQAIHDYRKKYPILLQSVVKSINKQPVEHFPMHMTKGELESIQNNQVLLDGTVTLKGWIDFSNTNLKALIVKINDEPYRVFPDLIRGELVEKFNNYNILGFDITIDTIKYGSRLKIDLYLLDKNGKEYKWKKYFLWNNCSVAKIYTHPIISGNIFVKSLNGRYECVGEIDVENIDDFYLEYWQKGKRIGEHHFSTEKRAFKFELPSVYIEDFPLFVWVVLANNRKCYWEKICNKDLNINHESSLLEPFFGQVIETNQVLIRGTVSEESIITINGHNFKDSINADFELILDTSILPNQLHIEMFGNNSYSSVLCWNHREMIRTDDNNFCFVVPSRSLIDKTIHRNSTNKKVLLIRQNEAPTDELYVLASIKYLQKKYSIELQIVNLDDEKEAMSYQNYLSGAHVIVSRYLTPDWIRLLTDKKDDLAQLYYLMDDDVGGAADSIWMPGGYRQRMMKVANGEFQTMLSLCDRFIATSKFIFHRYKSDKTDLLEPPYLEPLKDLLHLNKEMIIISYHATQVHRDDLLFIAEALREIHDRYLNVRIQIVMGNYVPAVLKDLPRIEIINGMSWEEYKIFIRQCRAHIALAPLLDTTYNRGKSVIKFFDISRLGALGFYTNTFPYDEVIVNGENGILLENDPLMWQKTLGWFIEHPEVLKKMAIDAQTSALKIGDISRINDYWASMLGCEG